MPEPSDAVRQAQRRYWRSNLTIMLALLLIWAAVGLGCGVLFADTLNDIGRVGGVPLGFWFAQQGSIITFVFIILFYALAMNRLDAKYHREVAALPAAAKPTQDPGPDTNTDTDDSVSQDADEDSNPQGGDA